MAAQPTSIRWALSALVVLVLGLIAPASVAGGEDEHPVERHYVTAPPAPKGETLDQAAARSVGCKSCHTASEAASMHRSDAVVLGCVDCHGGDAGVVAPAGLAKTESAYASLRDRAHGNGGDHFITLGLGGAKQGE